MPLVDGGTQQLSRIVGLGRALDILLTGRTVLADEALAIGLIFVGGFGVAQAQSSKDIQSLIAQLQAQILALQQQLIEQQGQTAVFCYDFNTNLGFAQSGTADVKARHTALEKQ